MRSSLRMTRVTGAHSVEDATELPAWINERRTLTAPVQKGVDISVTVASPPERFLALTTEQRVLRTRRAFPRRVPPRRAFACRNAVSRDDRVEVADPGTRRSRNRRLAVTLAACCEPIGIGSQIAATGSRPPVDVRASLLPSTPRGQATRSHSLRMLPVR